MNNSTKSHHILPLRTYLAIGGVLLIATAITVWVAQHDFGPYNLLVAMVIAAIKATLVAMFFMHLKYDNKLYMFVFVGGVLFLAVFITLTMFDTQRRDDLESVVAGPINSQAIIYQPTDNLEHAAAADMTHIVSDSAVSSSVDE